MITYAKDTQGRLYVNVCFLLLIMLGVCGVCVTRAVLGLIEKAKDEKFELKRRLVNHWYNLDYNRREIVALWKEVTKLKKQRKK